MASNYDDVLDQLRAGGLIITDGLEVGRLTKCKVEGDREKRGWYILHEIVGQQSDHLLVGSFGIWRGNDNGATKIKLGKGQELTREQRTSLAHRLTEDRKRSEAARKADADRAAHAAGKAWADAKEQGESPYLIAKGVGAHGVRFSPGGSLLIPMLDVAGRVHGLQVIRPPDMVKRERKLAKEYWPAGLDKKGHFHLIGGVPSTVLMICEGYATGASLHEATGLPVAVAFDAGNLAPVAAALRKRYKQVRILVCADDDAFATCANRDGDQVCRGRIILALNPIACPACGREHGRQNTGVMAASSAAVEAGGAWIKPAFRNDDERSNAFLDRGGKVTDFNDLHLAEGLHVVRAQIEAKLQDLGWSTSKPARSPHNGGQGGGGPLRPIETIDELLERYALVYGKGGMVFDRIEHTLISLSDMRDACSSRNIHRDWMEHPERVLVREEEVGFDPAGTDTAITCNLWGGWPTVPKSGRCERLLDLLRYMCSGDTDPRRLYEWVLRWVAYPIQHPGAKLKTALVIHGPQGTGKNMFFEAVMSIYGRYGRIIDQAAIEDKHNSWASRKLFLIADEVIARSEIFQVKNKLKSLITGDRIRINPKHMAEYEERNCANIVFLSNEPMPVVLEEDDRRHAVIWTPDKLEPEFYAGVLAEIRDGGIEALHDYLLHLDLGDFTAGSAPPNTAARNDLIDLGLDSTTRFYDDLVSGEIGGIRPGPCLSSDLYELYKLYCARTGQRHAPSHKLVHAIIRKRPVKHGRKRYDSAAGVKGPHAVVFINQSLPPDGTTEPAWLGQCIRAFRVAVDDYRGGVTG